MLQLTCDLSCRMSVIGGLPVEPPDPARPSALHVWLGRGQKTRAADVLVAVRVAAVPAPGLIHVHCALTDAHGAPVSSPVTMQWQVVDAAANDAQPVHHDVVRAVTAALAEAARAQVADAQARGAHDDARAIVQAVSRHLRVLSGGSVDAEMAIARLHAAVAGTP